MQYPFPLRQPIADTCGGFKLNYGRTVSLDIPSPAKCTDASKASGSAAIAFLDIRRVGVQKIVSSERLSTGFTVIEKFINNQDQKP